MDPNQQTKLVEIALILCFLLSGNGFCSHNGFGGTYSNSGEYTFFKNSPGLFFAFVVQLYNSVGSHNMAASFRKSPERTNC